MKYNKVFRILALAVIFSLLMLVIPAASALAAASIDLSPTKGKIGTTVRITGDDFPPSTTTPLVEKYVDIYFSKESASVGEDIDTDVLNYESKIDVYVDEDGEFDTTFKVPAELADGDEDEDVKAGTYYFYVTYGGATQIRTKDTFTVIVPGLSLSPTSDVVGTEVTISGTNFADDEDIAITYDDDDITADIDGDETTDDDGAFSFTVPIPESTAGKHTIAVAIGTDEAEVKFTVEPEIALTPVSGKIGDSVKVTGTGFAKSKDVTITFDGDPVETDESVTTGSNGSFEATFTVPPVGPGTYDVTAEDGSNNEASARFTISTNISISPVTSQASPGHVGTPVTISGTGFIANHDITITYTSEPVVFHTPSGADGSFTYTLTVPPSEAGAHTINASDGTSSMQVTFFMESTSPPIPPPLLPMMGVKADAKTYFDWEDVKDDSMPVTYTLQIATDANFTTILLEKTGLTTSEYTLTEAEKLESTKKEAPYYWRLRAVDAAANASGWTTPGTFYVGFAFGFPELKGWVLYALMGAGGLVLFFLGLWVGRRRGGGSEY